MAVSVPTPSQLREIASEVGLDLTDTDVTSFIELMRPSVAAYNVVDAMPDNLPAARYPRAPGYRPMGEENTHNAWYVKTKVEGASSGKLRGKTVVLKDNIMLAGVPMMNGSATLEGYMPDIDATVVERILDAGGTIAGKAHCEAFCLSGGSHTKCRLHPISRRVVSLPCQPWPASLQSRSAMARSSARFTFAVARRRNRYGNPSCSARAITPSLPHSASPRNRRGQRSRPSCANSDHSPAAACLGLC